MARCEVDEIFVDWLIAEGYDFLLFSSFAAHAEESAVIGAELRILRYKLKRTRDV